jgi:hypothetical protein
LNARARTTILIVVGKRSRFVLAGASMALAGVAIFLMFNGGWTVACPETQSTGFMDCGGQPDAVWRSDLPGWVGLELLFGATVVGAAGLALAVVLELWSRRPRRREQRHVHGSPAGK